MPINKYHFHNKSIIYILVFVTGIILIRNAWLGDDAYIGFRTVYNFTHSFGLTFNINERVQSFTNPLWIMIMSFLYLFTGEVYFTCIILSIILTLFSLYYLAVKLSDSYLTTILIFVLACASKAFIDYSTSGLENPLGYLFIVLFATVYFKEIQIKKKLFLLFFIASLAAVNRLDNLLLYVVPLIVQLKYISKNNILIILAGILPLIIWEAFSLLYFGFLFPNTFYTKLYTGLPTSEYISQGIKYLKNSFQLDAITLCVILLSIILTFFISVKNNKYKVIPFALSVLIYLFYTVKVGGDFMSGRFLTYIFLISIIIFTQIEINKIGKIIFICLIGVFTIVSPYSPIKSNKDYRKNELTFSKIVTHNGVADERAWYFPRTGLLHLNKDLYALTVERNLDTVQVHNDNTLKYVEIEEVLGFLSYEVGPYYYIFHHLGLTDPLIARLPRDEDAADGWRIGHIDRKIPEGYLETLKTGSNKIKDKNLNIFYDKLSILTKGKIFSSQRFKTILKMNMGQYDYLIDKKFYSSVKNR